MAVELDLTDSRVKKMLFYLYTYEGGYRDELDRFKSSLVEYLENEEFITKEGYHGYPYWCTTEKLDRFVEENGIVTLRWRLKRKFLRWLNS